MTSKYYISIVIIGMRNFAKERKIYTPDFDFTNIKSYAKFTLVFFPEQ